MEDARESQRGLQQRDGGCELVGVKGRERMGWSRTARAKGEREWT